jgi:hypothetical protein
MFSSKVLLIRNIHTGIRHIIPFQYNRIEAGKKIFQIHEDRLLTSLSLDKNESKLPMIARRDPLRSVYLPFFNFFAKIKPVQYDASYGIDHKGKPHLQTKTNWSNLSEKISGRELNPNNINATIYAGFTYPQSDIEEILNKFDFRDQLLPPTILDILQMRQKWIHFK